MNPDDAILVELLARIDAVFIPFRKVGTAAQNAHQRSRAYPDSGVFWHRRRLPPAEEKARQRQHHELAAAGMMDLIGRSTMVSGVRATPRGEDRARALVGLPTFADSIPTIRRLIDLAADPEGTDDRPITGTPGPWTQETKLAGTEYGLTIDPLERRKLVDVEERLMSAMVRGVVRSASDAHGHVWYAPAVPDHAWLDQVTRAQHEPGDKPKSDAEAFALYYREIDLGLSSMATHTLPNVQDIGIALMSCSPKLRGAASVR